MPAIMPGLFALSGMISITPSPIFTLAFQRFATGSSWEKNGYNLSSFAMRLITLMTDLLSVSAAFAKVFGLISISPHINTGSLSKLFVTLIPVEIIFFTIFSCEGLLENLSYIYDHIHIKISLIYLNIF
ncbi:TVG0443276 [Thermoplasma volcanium GSS1]|uniref:TVG0443276 protein n=1 Tax=Thermoplasma volcanium (strain ATCC 51530 / DSM 4299 / JCM 9571 / NBRC 15438 / GSS1) TaxID=273116 RepID=Q97BK0_THEVO|nr:TVG0443276 [Thermoplasma volcanium GSS1]